jgi:hypothetical protein
MHGGAQVVGLRERGSALASMICVQAFKAWSGC